MTLLKNLDIFVGNPGTGKSTLVSSISGAEFDSGVAFGGGYTKELKMVGDMINGKDVRFGDTPGLADVELAEQAARAIESAIKDCADKGRMLKLIFVVTEEAGRIRPEDVMTIEKVVTSITLSDGSKPKDNSYSVIVNKFYEEMFNSEEFQSRGRMQMELPFAEKNDMLSVTTTEIFYCFFLEELDYAENERIKDREKLQQLRHLVIETCPAVETIKNVNKIKSTADSNFKSQSLESSESLIT